MHSENPVGIRTMPQSRETEYIDVIRVEQDDGPVHEAVIFLRAVWYARITYDRRQNLHRISTKKRDRDAAKRSRWLNFTKGAASRSSA